MQHKTQVTSHESRVTRAEEAKIVQLIVFNLGEEEFAVEIEEVKEIINAEAITPIPDSPEFIKGIINVRGNIIAVIDLKARFFLRPKKEDEDKHIIITKNDYGIMVNEVTEISRLPETAINEAPELVTKIHEEYIKGVITLENRLIILLDFTKVLSEEELVKLTEVSRRHEKTTGARKESEITEVRGKQKSEKPISSESDTEIATEKGAEKAMTENATADDVEIETAETAKKNEGGKESSPNKSGKSGGAKKDVKATVAAGEGSPEQGRGKGR